MNKRLLVLAVAGAFGAAGAASAHTVGEVDLSIGGYVESGFVVSDESGDVVGGPNTSERKFDTEGEVSFRASVNDNAYVRVDLDINSRYSADDEIIVDQLYGGLRINDMVSVRVGRFNNPLGYESQDAPHKTTYSRSLISSELDGQTSLYQDNIEGVALDLEVGPANVTLAVLNEIGDVDEENSFLAHVSGEALPGLKLALGVLTQEDFDATNNPNSYETLINFNAAYKVDLGAVNTTFFVDYLTAGEQLDNAYSVGAKAMFTDTFGGTLRYDMAEFDNDAERTALTVGVNWAAAQSVDVRAEWRNQEFENAAGVTTQDDDAVILSAVFSF